MTIGLESFFYSRKLFPFLLHNTSNVTKGGKGEQFSGRRITAAGQKVTTMWSTFFKTVNLFPKDLRFEHGGAKLASFPRHHLTSLRPCTARLSSQNGEICLQKYLPISGKLSITNHLEENAVDYWSHLTIENNFNVDEKVYYSENKHNFPSPKKTRMGCAYRQTYQKIRKQ